MTDGILADEHCFTLRNLCEKSIKNIFAFADFLLKSAPFCGIMKHNVSGVSQNAGRTSNHKIIIGKTVRKVVPAKFLESYAKVSTNGGVIIERVGVCDNHS